MYSAPCRLESLPKHTSALKVFLLGPFNGAGSVLPSLRPQCVACSECSMDLWRLKENDQRDVFCFLLPCPLHLRERGTAVATVTQVFKSLP